MCQKDIYIEKPPQQQTVQYVDCHSVITEIYLLIYTVGHTYHNLP